MAPDARVRRGRVRADALDAFCDALWLEDGLAPNTIAAYRADLEQLQQHLERDLLEAQEAEFRAKPPRELDIVLD